MIADGGDLREHAEINVTPFIDVMLVLLIIFMVAAPLATVDVPVDLPASTAPERLRPAEPLFVSVTTNAGLLVGETPADLAGLGATLDATTLGDHDTRIFLRADKTIGYGRLMTVMNALRDAGYLKIALMALEETGQ